jgi:hypothetical protein
VVFASSGPYQMEPFDTLKFVVAMVVGQDYEDISSNVDRVWEVYQNNYLVKSVPQPLVTGEAADREAILSWDNSIDLDYLDPVTGSNTLEGYRIYRTEDANRLSWDLIDSLPRQYFSGPLIPEAYEYSDSPLMNGFYYSYSVTAYDSSGAESGIAVLSANLNTVELRPHFVANTNLNAIKVVPNPYVISAQWERERLGNISDGEPIRDLAFINLPAQCTIKIFTIDGDLLKTLYHNDGTGTAYWDIRTDYNKLVATGVYFYHVASPGGEKLGKFAIIR